LQPKDHDSVAVTTTRNPEPGIELLFFIGDLYISPVLLDTDGTQLDVGTLNVPVSGFDANGQMFIFYSTDSATVTEVAGGEGLDVFYTTPDNGVGTNWANPGVDNANWSLPVEIASSKNVRQNAPLAAVTRLAGKADVFWIGPDGAPASCWAPTDIASGAWNPPFPITPPGAARADSPIAAVTRFDGELDVFWIGPDEAIASCWANPDINSGNWHPAFPITLGGAARADSPIAAVTRSNGELDVFWIGPDGAIASCWANPDINNGDWHPAFPITLGRAARVDSPIAAVTRLNGELDVFWIGPDGAIASCWANPDINNGDWHPAFPITPRNAAGPYSPIAAVTRLNGQLDVLWTGVDRAVATCWANPAINNGNWNPPFPITLPWRTAARPGLAAISRASGMVVDLMGRTVLARAMNNEPTNLQVIYEMSALRDGGQFINISCAVMPDGLAGLPFEGPALLAWGSGRYRRSNVCFACIPLNEATDDNTTQASWWYFAGENASQDGRNGRATSSKRWKCFRTSFGKLASFQ
jgi:hypothetical protein